jgi:electron transfer flavoprotein beta subunit
VKKIDNVVLQAKEAKKIDASDAEINLLMKELIDSHAIG